MRAVIAGCALLVLVAVGRGDVSRGLFAAVPPTPRVEHRWVTSAPLAQGYSPRAPVAYVDAQGAFADRRTGWSNAGVLAAGATLGAALGYVSKTRGVRAPSPQMQEDDDGRIDGISGALGGGKYKSDVEKNPIVEIGSLVAFLITLGGLTFAAVNPDAAEEIAKSYQKPCTADKIVNGKKIVCQPNGKYAK